MFKTFHHPLVCLIFWLLDSFSKVWTCCFSIALESRLVEVHLCSHVLITFSQVDQKWKSNDYCRILKMPPCGWED